MSVITGILLALLFIAAILLIRSVTTLFHELGHALPALWFTQGPVIVHVGSYGNLNGSLQIPLGRLKIFLKFNPLAWNLGLCPTSGRSQLTTGFNYHPGRANCQFVNRSAHYLEHQLE